MVIMGIGIDIVDVERFFTLSTERGNHFLSTNFTHNELDYCFSFASPSEHLAGTFAAKEAVWKSLGISDCLQSSIEIRREKNGKPIVWIDSIPQESILLSISHTETLATAIALNQK